MSETLHLVKMRGIELVSHVLGCIAVNQAFGFLAVPKKWRGGRIDPYPCRARNKHYSQKQQNKDGIRTLVMTAVEATAYRLFFHLGCGVVSVSAAIPHNAPQLCRSSRRRTRQAAAPDGVRRCVGADERQVPQT